MFIAHVLMTVAESDLENAMQALLAEVPQVRVMPGCLAFVPFYDATTTCGVGVLHEWESEDHFNAYLASPTFATVGEVLRPMATAPPVSRRFDAQLKDTVV